MSKDSIIFAFTAQEFQRANSQFEGAISWLIFAAK